MLPVRGFHAQQIGDFFLDIDDQLGPLQLPRRASFSRSSSAMRTRSALRSTGLRPRLLGARALRTPWSRCARHLLRWEEYRPSRRRMAPISPRLAHGVGRLQDPPLVFGGEPTAPRLRGDLGVRQGRVRVVGLYARPPGSLRGRRRGHTLRRIRSHHRFRSFSPSLIGDGEMVSPTLAQRGAAGGRGTPSPEPPRRCAHG